MNARRPRTYSQTIPSIVIATRRFCRWQETQTRGKYRKNGDNIQVQNILQYPQKERRSPKENALIIPILPKSSSEEEIIPPAEQFSFRQRHFREDERCLFLARQTNTLPRPAHMQTKSRRREYEYSLESGNQNFVALAYDRHRRDDLPPSKRQGNGRLLGCCRKEFGADTPS